MKTKKGDFVTIDYVAREKDSGRIFDLTKAAVAKQENIFNEKFSYTPVTVCVGERDVLPGLDDALVDKDTGKEFIVEIPPEHAFGRKHAQLMQLVATNKLLKSRIKPFPGLQLNVDGRMGTIKSVSGGRTLIDFNHPLAGRTVVYEVTIQKVLSSPEEKLQALVEFHIQQGVKTSLKEGKAHVDVKIPKNVELQLREKILRLVPGVQDVVFKSDSA